MNGIPWIARERLTLFGAARHKGGGGGGSIPDIDIGQLIRDQARVNRITQFTPQGNLIFGQVDEAGRFLPGGDGQRQYALRMEEAPFIQRYRQGAEDLAILAQTSAAPRFANLPLAPIDSGGAPAAFDTIDIGRVPFSGGAAPTLDLRPGIDFRRLPGGGVGIGGFERRQFGTGNNLPEPVTASDGTTMMRRRPVESRPTTGGMSTFGPDDLPGRGLAGTAAGEPPGPRTIDRRGIGTPPMMRQPLAGEGGGPRPRALAPPGPPGGRGPAVAPATMPATPPISPGAVPPGIDFGRLPGRITSVTPGPVAPGINFGRLPGAPGRLGLERLPGAPGALDLTGLPAAPGHLGLDRLPTAPGGLDLAALPAAPGHLGLDRLPTAPGAFRGGFVGDTPDPNAPFGTDAERAASAIFERGAARLAPGLERRAERLLNRLDQRGIPVTSAAYADAVREMITEPEQALYSDLALGAETAGLAELDRIFGRGLAARGQRITGEEARIASNLARRAAGLDEEQARVATGLARRAAGLGELERAGTFDLARRAAGLDEAQARVATGLARRAAGLGEEESRIATGLARRAAGLDEEESRIATGLARRAAGLGEEESRIATALARRAAGLQGDLAAGTFANAARAAALGEEEARVGTDLARSAADIQAQLGAGQFRNAARAQNLAEQQALRSTELSELLSILGLQPAQPLQLGSFFAPGAVDVTGPAQMAQNAAIARAQADQAANANLFGLLATVGRVAVPQMF